MGNEMVTEVPVPSREDSPEKLLGSPLHNPFGRLKRVSLQDMAENN